MQAMKNILLSILTIVFIAYLANDFTGGLLWSKVKPEAVPPTPRIELEKTNPVIPKPIKVKLPAGYWNVNLGAECKKIVEMYVTNHHKFSQTKYRWSYSPPGKKKIDIWISNGLSRLSIESHNIQLNPDERRLIWFLFKDWQTRYPDKKYTTKKKFDYD